MDSVTKQKIDFYFRIAKTHKSASFGISVPREELNEAIAYAKKVDPTASVEGLVTHHTLDQSKSLVQVIQIKNEQ
jgi:hypothetical protein